MTDIGKADLDNITFIGKAKDFLEEYGAFDRDMLISVVKNPTEAILDPKSHEVGYPYVRFRRGDITVVVGFKTPASPAVTYVYLHRPDEQSAKGSVQGAGEGAGSSIPSSQRALKAALVKAGCKLSFNNASGHIKVRYRDSIVGDISSTPSDKRTIANDYKAMMRKMAAIDRRATEPTSD